MRRRCLLSDDSTMQQAPSYWVRESPPALLAESASKDASLIALVATWNSWFGRTPAAMPRTSFIDAQGRQSAGGSKSYFKYLSACETMRASQVSAAP